MNTPVVIQIELAKTELITAVNNVQQKYKMPPCIMEGIITSMLAEVRSEAKTELINATNTVMQEINEELEKAKAAAKKVLKAEPERVSESDTGQQGGNPEE